MARKRYALCGLSNRGISQFVLPILGRVGADAPSFADRAELVGILDVNRLGQRGEGHGGAHVHDSEHRHGGLDLHAPDLHHLVNWVNHTNLVANPTGLIDCLIGMETNAPACFYRLQWP